MSRQMDWGVGALEQDCACTLIPEAVVAAGRMKLQQNLPSDREVLSDQINTLHGELEKKRARLDEKVNSYLEHHNAYLEKKDDLISTASEPAFVNDEGRTVGWDRLASDSASKRTKHKLDLVAAATTSQLAHATALLELVMAHDKLCAQTYGSMEKFGSGYSDFSDAVSHSKHMCQVGLDVLKLTLIEHVASHKRFLGRIVNARSALSRGVTASAAMEEFYNQSHQQSGADGGQFVEGPDGPGRKRDAGKEDLGKPGTNQPGKSGAGAGAIADHGETKAATPAPAHTPVADGKPLNSRSAISQNNASATKESVNSALDAIDAVHGMPDGMKKILVRDSSPDTDARNAGAYSEGRGKDEGLIQINSKGANSELVFAHEFGHYLDSQIGVTQGFKDADEQVGKNLIDSILESATVKALMVHKENSKGDPMGAQHQRASYLGMQHEVFARAYAQYIGVRSGNEAIKSGVKRNREVPGEISKLSQWPDDEFESIAADFDEFFKSQGLRK